MKRRAPARRGRSYGAKRPKAIQTATAVPKTVLIKFKTDKTFVYNPATLPSGTDPLQTGFLDISMNNMVAPMSSAGSAGSWTAQVGSAGDNVEGLDQWVGTAQGRYRNYVVLGSKVTVNSIATQDIAAPGELGAPSAHYVNNYAIGIHKCTNGQSDVTTSTQLPTIQQFPYTRMRNMQGNQNSSASTGTVSQGARLSDNVSTKKWEGVSDVKDNAALISTIDATGAVVAPAEGGKYQLFIASREPKSTGKQVPSQLVRVHVEYIALLTDPITSNNDPMITE